MCISSMSGKWVQNNLCVVATVCCALQIGYYSLNTKNKPMIPDTLNA